MSKARNMWCLVALLFSVLHLNEAIEDLGPRVVRLPQSILPIQYNITIKTDPKGFHFSGKVIIEAEVREDTNSIILHASPRLSLSRVLLFTSKERNVPIKFDHDNITDLLIIQPFSSLLKKQNLILEVGFKGQLNEIERHRRKRAYFRVKTGDGDTEWMSGTVFEMVFAREVFPCWDEPLFKARFRLTMVHLPTHRAISNMPLLKSEINDGWIVDHFENTPLMSSFLVAFYLLKWNYKEIKTEDSRPLRVWAPDSDLVYANQSLLHAKRALEWLQTYTGVQDPMPKIDLVAIETFPTALENWGAIAFRPAALVGRNGYFDSSDFMTVTHELTHTWFGNLVSPKWWDSLWLSEGSAVFFSHLAMNSLRPDTFDLLEFRWRLDAYFLYSYNMNKALSYPMEYMEDLLHMPGYIYNTGYMLLRMLDYSIGPKKFQAGIQRYLTKLQFGNAEPSLLYQALQYEWEGKPVNLLMNEWTNRGGVPIITAKRSNGQLILTQEHYYNPGDMTLRNDTKWWVPITFTTQSERNFKSTEPVLWMRERAVLPDPAASSDWLLLNIKAAGPYIVHYSDPTNQKLIREAKLRPDHDGIDPIMQIKLEIEQRLYCLLKLEKCSKDDEDDSIDDGKFHSFLLKGSIGRRGF